MTLEEVREKLTDRIVKVVSQRTGLTEMTIIRLRDGGSDPRSSTVQILADYFKVH